jgi:hypothetical protein
VRAVCTLAAIILVASPSAAVAGASIHGALHAVVHAVTKEGGTVVRSDGTVDAKCKLNARRHFFACWFTNLTTNRNGFVRAFYARHRYRLGPIRYEPLVTLPHCEPYVPCAA